VVVGNKRWVVALCVSMLSGCISTQQLCEETQEVRLFRTPTEFMINVGIKNYEDGNYATSLVTLQTLLDTKTATKNEKILAYKYLAFIHCVSPKDEKKQCRESFKKALDLDSQFSLSPAEADHPMWGKEFRSVKNKLVK